MRIFIAGASIKDDRLWLDLSDGRALGVPLRYYPSLHNATAEQLARFEISPRGIHWDALNEDLSLEGLLVAKPLSVAQG